jgi:hypothetical protein
VLYTDLLKVPSNLVESNEVMILLFDLFLMFLALCQATLHVELVAGKTIAVGKVVAVPPAGSTTFKA